MARQAQGVNLQLTHIHPHFADGGGSVSVQPGPVLGAKRRHCRATHALGSAPIRGALLNNLSPVGGLGGKQLGNLV